MISQLSQPLAVNALCVLVDYLAVFAIGRHVIPAFENKSLVAAVKLPR